MAKRGGSVHVAVTRRHYKGREYTTTLLRRSYREDGKVRSETVGNLSHLPDWVIDSIRSMLAGHRLVDLDGGFEITRSLPHGHVRMVLDVINDLRLPGLLSRERCRERDLCVAMICQRVIAPCSKLSMTRLLAQTSLAGELELGEVSEKDLLAGMDWLLERQGRVEKALARRHLADDGFVLYDLSSSYLDGSHCELAAYGYSRDRKRGKLQIEYGLCCDRDGRPVSVTVFDGNTADPMTLKTAVSKVKKDFQVTDLVVVGDRGMITQTRISEDLQDLQVGYITALKAPQIKR